MDKELEKFQQTFFTMKPGIGKSKIINGLLRILIKHETTKVEEDSHDYDE